MDIVPPYTILRTCKLCHEEQPHERNGFYISPVCLHCMKTLPPVPSGMKRCPTCLQFHASGHPYCAMCQSNYNKTHYKPAVARNRNLKHNHSGLTLEEYECMLFQQGGVCAICKQPETVIDPYTGKLKVLSVDHHHETGLIRELLCASCNHLLGWIEKDRNRVKMALKYLKKHDM